MALFAIVDKTSLERRLDTRDDGFINIAFALFASCDFDVDVDEDFTRSLLACFCLPWLSRTRFSIYSSSDTSHVANLSCPPDIQQE